MDPTTSVLALPRTVIGAAAAPEGPAQDVFSAAPLSASKLPAFGLFALGGTLGIGAALLRRANPLARIGGGLLGLGVAATGAMMLAMGGTSDSHAGNGDVAPTTGPSGPASAPGSHPTGGLKPLAFNQEHRQGPTPSGGAYSIASYFDANGDPIAKADASSVSIVEYDADGGRLRETTGMIGGG